MITTIVALSRSFDHSTRRELLHSVAKALKEQLISKCLG